MLENEKCQFCGHAGYLKVERVADLKDVSDEIVAPLYSVVCGYCGASGPMEMSERKARNAWKGSLKNKGVTVEGAIPCRICGGLPEVQRLVEGNAGETVKATKVWCPTCQHIVSETWSDIHALDTEGGHTGGFCTEEHKDFLLKRVVERWNEANRD